MYVLTHLQSGTYLLNIVNILSVIMNPNIPATTMRFPFCLFCTEVFFFFHWLAHDSYIKIYVAINMLQFYQIVFLTSKNTVTTFFFPFNVLTREGHNCH